MSNAIATAPVTSPADELKTRLDAMTPQELDLRRRDIVNSANGDYESLSVESLQELSFIVATLRRRSAGPPKSPRVAGGSSPKAKPTIDSLV